MDGGERREVVIVEQVVPARDGEVADLTDYLVGFDFAELAEQDRQLADKHQELFARIETIMAEADMDGDAYLAEGNTAADGGVDGMLAALDRECRSVDHDLDGIDSALTTLEQRKAQLMADVDDLLAMNHKEVAATTAAEVPVAHDSQSTEEHAS